MTNETDRIWERDDGKRCNEAALWTILGMNRLFERAKQLKNKAVGDSIAVKTNMYTRIV